MISFRTRKKNIPYNDHQSHTKGTTMSKEKTPKKNRRSFSEYCEDNVAPLALGISAALGTGFLIIMNAAFKSSNEISREALAVMNENTKNAMAEGKIPLYPENPTD